MRGPNHEFVEKLIELHQSLPCRWRLKSEDCFYRRLGSSACKKLVSSGDRNGVIKIVILEAFIGKKKLVFLITTADMQNAYMNQVRCIIIYCVCCVMGKWKGKFF
jgi:hypothetical protein